MFLALSCKHQKGSDRLCVNCNAYKSGEGGRYPFDVCKIKQGTFKRNSFAVFIENRMEFWGTEAKLRKVCELRRRQLQTDEMFSCYKLNVEAKRLEFIFKF